MLLKECPSCGSLDLHRNNVRVKCNLCNMTGPQRNGGKNDDHVDYIDGKHAVVDWNSLPRKSGHNKTRDI